jgi:hypothetical protein
MRLAQQQFAPDGRGRGEGIAAPDVGASVNHPLICNPGASVVRGDRTIRSPVCG